MVLQIAAKIKAEPLCGSYVQSSCVEDFTEDIEKLSDDKRKQLIGAGRQ